MVTAAVPVTGVLNNFHVEDSGRITAVLDRVQISVDSIYKIRKPRQHK